MRFWAPLFALAAVAFAQDHNNQINTPNGGFGAQAGQSITITWTNPSSGNVDIRLTQGSNIQPGAGFLLQSNVPASAGTATITLPDGASLNGQEYNFEIVPVDDQNNPNFSSPFVVAGASGTGSTTDSSSMSMTSTDSASSTASASATSTDSTASSTDSASASASASSSESAASSSASAAATTAAHNMGASSHQIGGVLAMVAGALAVF